MTDPVGGALPPASQRLRGFVRILYADVGWAALAFGDLLPDRNWELVHLENETLLESAWEQVALTMSTTLEVFEQLADDDLARGGLAGPELKLKLALYHGARRALQSLLMEQATPVGGPLDLEAPDPPTRPLGEGWRRRPRTPRAAKRILRALNILLERGDVALESLLQVARQAERLVEFKKVIEKLAGDAATLIPNE